MLKRRPLVKSLLAERPQNLCSRTKRFQLRRTVAACHELIPFRREPSLRRFAHREGDRPDQADQKGHLVATIPPTSVLFRRANLRA